MPLNRHAHELLFFQFGTGCNTEELAELFESVHVDATLILDRYSEEADWERVLTDAAALHRFAVQSRTAQCGTNLTSASAAIDQELPEEELVAQILEAAQSMVSMRLD